MSVVPRGASRYCGSTAETEKFGTGLFRRVTGQESGELQAPRWRRPSESRSQTHVAARARNAARASWPAGRIAGRRLRRNGDTVELYSPRVTRPDATLTDAREEEHAKQPNLSVTALYTAATWAWGGLPGAELFASEEGRTVFRVTNLALAIARLFNRDLRSLRHALLHRHAMIDHLLRASGAREVVELAAGLSRRGATFSADPGVRYTEVDLGPMIAQKRALLERTEAGRAVLARPNLHLVEGDVLEVDLSSTTAPPRLRNRTSEDPLFVIAEGLFMYLRPEQQRALFREVRGLFGAPGAPSGERSGTFVLDLVPACEEPEPGPAGRALGWLMKRFTGGKGFERDARTRHDVAAELRQAGFDDVEMIEPAAVAGQWGLPFPDVPTRQLVFVARVTAEERRTS